MVDATIQLPDPLAGTDRKDALDFAQALANETRLIVRFRFNEQPMEVTPK